MYNLTLISSLVQFIYLISLSECSVNPITLNISALSQDAHKFTVDEFSILNFRVINYGRILNGTCTGTCLANSRRIHFECRFLPDNELPNIFLDTNINVTRKDIGPWMCYYGNLITETVQFQLDVKVEEVSLFNGTNAYYAWGTIAAVVILVIIGQTVCIIYFRSKAIKNRRHANLSKKGNGATEDTVRYSTMPTVKNKLEQCTGTRESGIYEALENVRDPSVPRPPSLTTLPRAKKVHKPKNENLTITPEESQPSQNETLPKCPKMSLSRTLTNGIPMPSFGSLTRNKQPPKDTDHPDGKSSSLERIKARPKIPIPTEEAEYEVMEQSPTPPRKEFTENKGFKAGSGSQLRPTPVPKPSSYPHGAQPLQPHAALSSQLKQALGQRQRPLNVPPQRLVPSNPGLPRPLPVTFETPAPAPWTRPPPSNPDVPKWRPPPPTKPKPVQRPPPSPPEVRQFMGRNDDDVDWDDEWHMENLYNI